MPSLDGTTALVTGGAKRIGAAICRTLHAAGATPVVHARSSLEEAASLAQELDASVVAGDLASPEGLEGLLESAAAAADAPIDFVVNNASAFPRKTLAAAKYDDLDAMMRLHAWAPLVLARDLAEAGGKAVVNILDTRITSHDPEHFPYLMSKQALGDLTQTLARELAPLRVNGVAPGPILPPTDGSDDSLDAAVDATLLGRAGRPEEIAAAVRFLLEAEYTTGQVLFVDGGRHLKA